MSGRKFPVVVASEDGFCQSIYITRSDTIATFKAHLQQHSNFKYNLPIDAIKLTMGEVELCNFRTIEEYNIDDDSLINMSIKTDHMNINNDNSTSSPNTKRSANVASEIHLYDYLGTTDNLYRPPPNNGAVMEREIELYVGFLSRDKAGIDIKINQFATIKSLKQMIKSKDPEYTTRRQRIFLNGENLEEYNTLEHYNIDDGQYFFLYRCIFCLVNANFGLPCFVIPTALKVQICWSC